VTGILLAAGESRRMGRPKPLLPFAGWTVLEELVDKLRRAPLDEIVVVLGHRHEEMWPLVRGDNVRTVVNERYADGMLSSVKAGLAGCCGQASAFLLALVDQPFVRVETLRGLLAAYRQGDKGIVLPRHKGEMGHPVVIDMRYRAEILQLAGDRGLAELMDRHPADVLRVDVDDAGVLRDMDTPEDYLLVARGGVRITNGQ